jgi:hypothetical protein
MNADEYFKEHYKHPEIQMVAKESAIHFAEAYLKHKTKSQKSTISDVSLSFPYEDTFNVGFDEGYTSPLERNGKRITTEEYEAHRRECFDEWRTLIARNEG